MNRKGGEAMEKYVRKAKKGNADAFLKILDHYKEDLYRIAFVYVKNEADALDIMQEVAYKSFKSIHQLKEAAYLKTWLTRITINCSVDLLKKSQHLSFFEKIPEAEFEFEADHMMKMTLEDLLKILSVEEKTVILLRYYEQYTFQEIANLLNIPLGTAKTTVYRALKTLRQSMIERGSMDE